MYKEVLRDIDGVATYPIISMVVFVLFFIGLAIYVIRFDKKSIKRMKDMPLQDKIDYTTQSPFRHE